MDLENSEVNYIFNQSCEFSHEKFQTPTLMPRYSVLRDTYLNIIDYGLDGQLRSETLDHRNLFNETKSKSKFLFMIY